MRKFICILCLALAAAGCTEENTMPSVPRAEIILGSNTFRSSRVVDADNLAVEQTIKNISIFLTEPSADVVTHSFVFAGFSSVEDYKVVTLPVDTSELAVKDIYVIANYDDSSTLENVSSVTAIKELLTPAVDKNNNLDPADGFCMYGKTPAFDFTSGARAVVNVIRSCAKLRFTLRFPQEDYTSNDNSFVIAHAAEYTYMANDVTGLILPSDDYFNFATPIILEPDGSGNFVNVAYVYEATQVPQMYLYTRLNDSATQQEFVAILPVPTRNYLYDIEILVYGDQTRSSQGGNVRMEVSVTVYDESGNRIY